MLWLIDMACIVASYLISTYLRFNVKRDWGDKTLHYMVCVVFLLFCVIYTFLADWNRDFLFRVQTEMQRLLEDRCDKGYSDRGAKERN